MILLNHKFVLILFCLVTFSLLAGCSSTSGYEKDGFRISLPEWFAAPEPDEQLYAPLNIGMYVPEHLRELGNKHGLPGWVVYGVVRCLGAEELVAHGTIKIYTLIDYQGESTYVMDDVYYDVSQGWVDMVLSRISEVYSKAESDRERKEILGKYVVRRMRYIQGTDPEEDRNLLNDSGICADSMEVFKRGKPAEFPLLGWMETPTDYVMTTVTDFRYNDITGSFREAEEEAILELARSVLLNLQSLNKMATIDTIDGRYESYDELYEEIFAEEISARLSDVRVVRRMIDIEQGACLVVVKVPKSGVCVL